MICESPPIKKRFPLLLFYRIDHNYHANCFCLFLGWKGFSLCKLLFSRLSWGLDKLFGHSSWSGARSANDSLKRNFDGEARTPAIAPESPVSQVAVSAFDRHR